jgi:hypothetical protein
MPRMVVPRAARDAGGDGNDDLRPLGRLQLPRGERRPRVSWYEEEREASGRVSLPLSPFEDRNSREASQVPRDDDVTLGQGSRGDHEILNR